MAGTKTALSASAFSLDGNDHLADLQVFGLDLGVTSVETHGVAATYARNQVTKISGKHNFEILVDNTGPKRTNLDVSVWNPAGSSLLGELQSGSIKLTIPSKDGSGIADKFTYANIVGARRITIDTESFIPSSTSLHALITKAVSSTLSDRDMATVLLTLGSPLAFSLNMVLGDVGNSFSRDDIQALKASFLLAGSVTTVPGSTTLWGVAFAGDGLISLSANVGHGTFAGTGAITDLTVAFANGEVTKASGTLDMQGAVTYS